MMYNFKWFKYIGVLLRERKFISYSQLWFWSREWQAGEKEVDAYIQAGEYEEYDTLEELLQSL